jgi:hypothetical protein
VTLPLPVPAVVVDELPSERVVVFETCVLPSLKVTGFVSPVRFGPAGLGFEESKPSATSRFGWAAGVFALAGVLVAGEELEVGEVLGVVAGRLREGRMPVSMAMVEFSL